MSRFSSLVLFACLFPITAKVMGQPQATLSEVEQDAATGGVGAISRYLNDLVDSGELPGAVAIVTHKGKVVLHEALGLAELTPQRPMQRDTIFRLASMTKPITSIAVMMLIEEGKLSLDEFVSKRIPEFSEPKVVNGSNTRPSKREITIRHLLTHTSGLGYPNTETIGPLYEQAGIEGGVRRTSISLDENIRNLAKVPLLFDPGERFNYGMSTDVLGLIVERGSGMKLDSFLEERICKPLGMNDTYFTVPANNHARLPACYVANAGLLRELSDSEEIEHDIFKSRMSPSHAFPPKNSYLSGGGGMSGTASDYARLCQMILNGGELDGVRILKPATVDMMVSNQIGELDAGVGGVTHKFGFGFAIFPGVGGSSVQLGWGGIWGTVFRISKEED